MKVFARITIAGMVAVSALISGCASTTSGSVYSGSQAGREQIVRLGVVESVRQVTIESPRSGVGTIVGGVAGGLAGNAIEEGTTRKPGLELTVKLGSGELRAVTQDADESFRPGERVRLLSGNGVTRVTH